MLEVSDSLLPATRAGEKLKVLTVGFDAGSLEEMQSLLTTLELEEAKQVVAPLKKISPATYIGKGKVDEVKALGEAFLAEAVIFDTDLSPKQMHNLEKILKKRVLDRAGVIIEIFSRHARTKEAKTQVELARLQYLMPRLTHFWTHFERQRGGIGQKGMGEKQLEVDRRLLEKRMTLLRRRLSDIEKERNVQRAGRADILKVALVGYTNAGKSTLLNALTHSRVLAEDKLFATLDASVRALDPDSHPPVVAIDTVGFISNIPTSLIASFRSTLEELYQADLLVHVVDASAIRAREQVETTEQVLKELELDGKDRITVLNKIDQVKDGSSGLNRARLVVPGAKRLSALNLEEVRELRDMILNHFRNQLEVWDIVVPYDQGKLESQLHTYGSIETVRYLEKGTFYRVRIHTGWANKLELGKYKL
ncbi:MAG: GTPase HflX [Bacteriovoracia bacterium]